MLTWRLRSRHRVRNEWMNKKVHSCMKNEKQYEKSAMDMTLLSSVVGTALDILICTYPRLTLLVYFLKIDFQYPAFTWIPRRNIHIVICTLWAVNGYLGQSIPKARCLKLKMFHLSDIWRCWTGTHWVQYGANTVRVKGLGPAGPICQKCKHSRQQQQGTLD